MPLPPFRPPHRPPTSHWPRIWAVLLLAPAALALVTMSPMMVAVAINFTFGVPLALWVSVHVHRLRELPKKLPRGIRYAAVVSVTGLGLIGLFLFSVGLALASLAAYVVTVWVLPRSGPRPVGARTGVAAASSETPPPATDDHAEPVDVVLTLDLVRVMTDAELCRAWRHSFAALQQVRDPQLRARVVHTRQLLLDEFEERHPAGLEAWLGSGARAASGPDRFIGLDGSGQSEAA